MRMGIVEDEELKWLLRYIKVGEPFSNSEVYCSTHECPRHECKCIFLKKRDICWRVLDLVLSDDSCMDLHMLTSHQIWISGIRRGIIYGILISITSITLFIFGCCSREIVICPHWMSKAKCDSLRLSQEPLPKQNRHEKDKLTFSH